jgi:multidrug efflux pump subunit AcrA (membrane-fusion protein)
MNAIATMVIGLAAVGVPPDSSSDPTPTFAAPTQAAPGVIDHCQVFLIDDVKVPARESGVLISMKPRENSSVRKGTELAKIDDREAQIDKLASELERDAASARANDDIEVRYAEASRDVAAAELNESTEINRRSPGSVSAAELRRLELTRRRAELQIDRSRLELDVARKTADVKEAAVAAAAESIDRRRILAPFDGTVIDIVRQQGEWVNAGETVFRVIRLDRLRVEGFLDASLLNPEEIANRPVTVELARARGQVVRLNGEVTFVSPLVQAGEKYRVRAEIQNLARDGHWLLLPGMSASMIIHTDATAASTTSRPTPARR